MTSNHKRGTYEIYKTDNAKPFVRGGRKATGLKKRDGRAAEDIIIGMPGLFIKQKRGVMRLRFFSAEKTWEGLLAAAIVMSLILLFAMLAGNYL